jgi:hypothetical protein
MHFSTHNSGLYLVSSNMQGIEQKILSELLGFGLFHRLVF